MKIGKFTVNNAVKILMFTCKAVKRGELLVFDYNEGCQGTYDT